MAKKTETRPATGHINPFGLRMQPELRERLEAAAAASGRSLNAEIIAMLEMAEAGTHLSNAAMERQESLSRLVDSLLSTLSMTAHYLKLVVDMVPRESPERDALLDLITGYADGIKSGDFEAATKSIYAVVDIGKEMGILDQVTGRTKPEHAHLLEPKPKKAKS